VEVHILPARLQPVVQNFFFLVDLDEKITDAGEILLPIIFLDIHVGFPSYRMAPFFFQLNWTLPFMDGYTIKIFGEK
jgi:hypothetical protein